EYVATDGIAAEIRKILTQSRQGAKRCRAPQLLSLRLCVRNLFVWFHAPIKGGVHNALIVAWDTGCDTVQLSHGRAAALCAFAPLREKFLFVCRRLGFTHLSKVGFITR